LFGFGPLGSARLANRAARQTAYVFIHRLKPHSGLASELAGGQLHLLPAELIHLNGFHRRN